MESGRWHDSHLFWKIGATSLVNVGTAVCAESVAGRARRPRAPTAPITNRPTKRLAIFPSESVASASPLGNSDRILRGWGVYNARQGLSLPKPLMTTITYADGATSVYHLRA